MQFTDKRTLWRWFIILLSFLIVILIVGYTYSFFQTVKQEERAKMELWAQSMRAINLAGDQDDLTLQFQIVSENKTIPIIQTLNNKIVNISNLPPEVEKDSTAMKNLLEDLKKDNEPIKLEYLNGQNYMIFYGNSSLLTKLIYYPAALVLIIFLFGLMVYNFYRSTKISTQNKLWAGMAKETAHQIGTPLSSLIGWIEIMKADNVDETTVTEIEKDVVRLQTIADRFSKIGSEPALETLDIVEETQKSYDYLQSRFSNIAFTFSAPNKAIEVSVNPILHSWTIENLVKNAIDAMKGRGKLDIKMEEDARFVKITVRDSGKGIPKSQFTKIFEPGFTTKKRGWGLGLSLTKRIVEEYHKGRIKVLSSEVGKGTVMQVSFPKVIQ
ncbi:sensor histidine kinase [Flavobacterium silvaticum]|uniref:histidine kinase n=1 Tax=Flavobacterium silvaticum TaxID=1852020 RepID=A0A972FS83_9FLAO|nr:HAMP domain-containing sensor histidine kinase [Flavobacterium silvaticum]NMH27052.1 HAMP domain-containing histidine kinase [Flavobacterium silvaticum]